MKQTSRWLQGYFAMLLVSTLIILVGAIVQRAPFVLGGLALLVIATVVAAGAAIVLQAHKR
ncbi:MAG TPA: hypothetical protein VGF67_28185 [Ktedonobacteraceae bacterium]|jgi:hypothetical protein